MTYLVHLPDISGLPTLYIDIMSYIVGIRAHCAMIGFIISFRIHTAQLVTQFTCNAVFGEALQCSYIHSSCVNNCSAGCPRCLFQI